MTEPLKILMLEDHATDAEIVERLLKKQKLHFEFRLAMNKDEYLQALDQFQPDVILSDNSLPQFNATEALEIIQRRSLYIPFILVTGAVSEEFAAGIIKLGANDYILKDRLARLPAAIDAALKQRKTEKGIADYRYALDQSSIISITDQKGIIKYANDNFCKISKYSAGELIGQDHRIINSGFHLKPYINNLWTTIANGNIWRGEFRNKAKDGSIYWVDATIVPFLNKEGKPYQYLAIRIDITQRKKAEEELAEKEFFLRESQRAGNVGSYKTNFITGYWQSSETLDSIFGIDKNYDRSIAGWMEIVHPDDKQKLDEYLRLEVIGKRKSFNKEYRIVKINDKQTKWVYGLGDVKFDDSGNVTELIGTIQDITQQKNAEESLLQSETNLRTIFENTDTGFYLLDIEANIIAFNKKVNQFAKLSFGFELEEKRNLIKLFTPERQQQFADMLSEIIKGSNFNYEINYPQTDGTIIWYSVNANQVCESNGKMVGICVSVNDITERKKAEDKISESEENFRRLFNESADPILLLDDTGFTDCNHSAFSILGYSSSQEVLNKKPWDISPEKQPDGRLSTEKAEAMIAKALQQGYNKFEWVHTKSDGTEFPVEVMLTPIKLKGKQSFYTLWRNIAERKKSEEEMLRLSSILEATSDFVNIAAVDQRIVFLNKAGRIALGFGEREDLLQTKISDYSPDWANEIILKEGIPAALKTGKWIGETAFLTRGGVEIPISQVVVAHNNSNGELQYLSTIARDISVQKESEEKLKKYSAELQISNSELERFAYVASHDLQEPLRMVTSFLNLLEKRLDGQLDGTNKQYMNFAVDGADRMKILIKDLLQYSRVGSNKENFAATDLNEVMEYVTRVLKEDIKKNQAVVTVNPMPVITANKTLINQLFINLISNALKYHDGKEPLIEVGTTEKPDYWTFYVKDNGIGIDPKYFDKIFIIFQRLHNKNEFSGTGIGLAICKKIVDVHKGKIWVESEAGKGSTFFFSIPKNKI